MKLHFSAPSAGISEIEQTYRRAFSFGHLLKTVGLEEEKILFYWYTSTENGRLCRLQIAFFIKAHSFGHSVFGRLPRDL